MKRALHHISLVALFFILAQRVCGQTITAGFVAGHITACQGAGSQNQEIQYFTVTGAGLKANFSATTSPGFVISTSENNNFTTELSLQPSSGGIFDTLYVRLQALADTGVINGTITLSSNGAQTRYIAVSGNVLPAPVADTEQNITVLNGTTIPRLNFEGSNTNTYMWTSSNTNIGLAASGVDSLPTFRAIIAGNTPVTSTITVTPLWAGMAYTFDKTSNQVRIVNTVTNGLDTSIFTLGKYPQSECLSTDYKHLYVLNAVSANVTVVKTAINRVVNLLTLPILCLGPEQVAVSPNDSLIYILNGTSSNVFTLNDNTGQQIKVAATGGAYPGSMAVNPAGGSIYANPNSSQTTAIVTGFNVPSGNGFERVSIPFGGSDLVLTPDSTKLLFTYQDAIYVMNTATQSIQKFSTYTGAGNPVAGIAISPDGTLLYVIISGYGLYVYSMYDYTLKSQLYVHGTLGGLCINPDGTLLYVTSFNPNVVYVVNTQSNTLVATVPFANAPAINANAVTPGGCFGNPISFTITVNPDPLPDLSETGDLNAMTTVYGTPSASQSFTVSGTAMRAGVLVTPPPGFEVSLDNTNFSPTVTAGGGAAISNIPIYIRIAATTIVGNYSGRVLLTSPGAANITVAIPSSTVTPADLVITANNQTKAYGAPNPPLTLTITGFKNNDGIPQLVYAPVVSTTATLTSPAGTYPITVGGAYSGNYNISYVQGVLTIVPNIIIPNTFTPNGDGINDTWVIGKINNYPNCLVQVFSRYGQMVFQSSGYGTPWDGTYKGSRLPDGAYYYIINLNADVPLLSGFVAIIR